MNVKRPKPLYKGKKYRCVYNPAEDGLGGVLNHTENDGPCGKVTAKDGLNRFYCERHLRSISLRGSD